MIDPYAVIIASYLNEFARLGFSKVHEAEFSTGFSDGKNAIEINTEKYYHPSLSTSFVDEHGERFSVRILREILAPDQLLKDSSDLDAIKIQYGLDNPGIDQATRDLGIAAYVQQAIANILNFLSLHQSDLVSGSFRSEYAARAAVALKNIGL